MSAVVIDKMSLLKVIRQHQSEIRSFGVKSLGLFGSFVRDTASETSDVDLLVDFEPQKKTFDNFMDLTFFLEQLFGRKTELVTPQSLNKYIGPHILKEAENVGI